MLKQLKIWNGRGARIKNKEYHTLYICAYSRSDAARLIIEAQGDVFDKSQFGWWTREIRDYFTEGCWGNTMNGIVPERGVWATKTFTDKKPVKLI